MGLKADLAVELKMAMAENTDATALGGWLLRNVEDVVEALDWADDLVEIEEVSLAEFPLLVQELRRA
ncbi:MAG: hypothetical protein ACKOVA_19555 [Novosphingobium sp.]